MIEIVLKIILQLRFHALPLLPHHLPARSLDVRLPDLQGVVDFVGEAALAELVCAETSLLRPERAAQERERQRMAVEHRDDRVIEVRIAHHHFEARGAARLFRLLVLRVNPVRARQDEHVRVYAVRRKRAGGGEGFGRHHPAHEEVHRVRARAVAGASFAEWSR